MSALVDVMEPRTMLGTYARVCGTGGSHGPMRAPGTASRSPATSARATRSTAAMARFAETYADQNERDYAALKNAVDVGRVNAESGL